MNQNELRERAQVLKSKVIPYALMADMVGISRTMVSLWVKGRKNLGEENYHKMTKVIENLEKLIK